MTETTHYQQSDSLTPAEPVDEPPQRIDPAMPAVGPANAEPAPWPAPPTPLMALPLDVIIAALAACVVQTNESAADEWSTWRVNLVGEETRGVANRQPARRTIRIKNLGPGVAYICRQNPAAAGPNTWPLALLEIIALDTAGPVMACTDAGALAQLAVAAEYNLSGTEL